MGNYFPGWERKCEEVIMWKCGPRKRISTLSPLHIITFLILPQPVEAFYQLLVLINSARRHNKEYDHQYGQQGAQLVSAFYQAGGSRLIIFHIFYFQRHGHDRQYDADDAEPDLRGALFKQENAYYAKAGDAYDKCKQQEAIGGHYAALYIIGQGSFKNGRFGNKKTSYGRQEQPYGLNTLDHKSCIEGLT